MATVSNPTCIHLVRHGEVFNPQQLLYGRLPRFRLSDKGREQAQQAGVYLQNKPIAAVFSSPMLRARQTAALMFNNNGQFKTHISGLINEVCTAYQGRPGAELDARNGDIYSGAAACFEQPEDVVTRTRKFLGRIRKHHAGQQVAAVTHGDVVTFMVLWAQGFDLTPENKTRLLQAGYPVPYPAHASITTLVYNGASPHEKPEWQYRQPPIMEEMHS